jgi:N,N'-diacetyllegionaminate synthase
MTKIIAEAGVNHNGDLQKALKLVARAKTSGADYIKFQIYNRYEQISKYANTASYQKKNTKNAKMLKMASAYDLKLQDHKIIKKFAEKVGIKYLASCFDIDSVKFYKKNLNSNEIKIASGEITNLELLEFIKKKFKKIFLSTGMSSFREIKRAVNKLQTKENEIIIFHCISLYPAQNKDLNLNFIKTLKQKFKRQIGFSDHTKNNYAAQLAVACGATYLEKHITLSNKMPGPDHKASLNPKKMELFINSIKKVDKILGSYKKTINKNELQMIKYARRGIVAKRNLSKGSIINKKNFTFKRPCVGIPCESFNKYHNKIITKNLLHDQNLFLTHLK